MKYIRILLIAASIIVVFIAGWALWKHQESRITITNYEQCLAAGNLVRESYPAVCVTPEGDEFVQPVDPNTIPR